MRLFNRAGAYRWACKQSAAFRSSAMAAAFGVSHNSATQMVVRLRKDGALTQIGRSRNSTWIVIRRGLRLEGMFGMHPNSLANLKWRWTKRTNRSHHSTPKVVERYKAIPLEQCWPLPPNSNVDASVDADIV